jgi:hypothetical protein
VGDERAGLSVLPDDQRDEVRRTRLVDSQQEDALGLRVHLAQPSFDGRGLAPTIVGVDDDAKGLGTGHVRGHRLNIVSKHDDHGVGARGVKGSDLGSDEGDAKPGQQRLGPPHAGGLARGDKHRRDTAGRAGRRLVH